jgi:hypothetical protein
VKQAILTILAVSALSGCGSGPWTLSATAPTSSAVASPTVSGEVFSGSEDCAFYTSDGDYTVYDVVQGVADCGEISQVLASFGKFWSPVSYSTVTREQQDGMLPDAARYCGLNANGGMYMAVYQVTAVDEPIGSGVAGDICTSEEANGWTPGPGGAN